MWLLEHVWQPILWRLGSILLHDKITAANKKHCELSSPCERGNQVIHTGSFPGTACAVVFYFNLNFYATYLLPGTFGKQGMLSYENKPWKKWLFLVYFTHLIINRGILNNFTISEPTLPTALRLIIASHRREWVPIS